MLYITYHYRLLTIGWPTSREEVGGRETVAEKTFRILTNISAHHPEIRCVAVTREY